MSSLTTLKIAVLENSLSEPVDIAYGVSHGPTFGPLLFNTYIQGQPLKSSFVHFIASSVLYMMALNKVVNIKIRQ